MSNAFTNFLSGVSGGLLGDGGATMRDYQHADRLYVKNNYARAPKVSYLYFINFNINQAAIIDQTWLNKGRKEVGLLVKKADLPKFTITTETLNQYNRKTVIQTKLNYGNINIDFHDDNSDISNDLWKNYYQYYYMDSVYGSASGGKSIVPQYGDTKYSTQNYAYGLDNFQSIPFFDSVDIYVLHKGHGPNDFTQITLVNPKIVDWTHDSVNQDDSNKTMTNKMTLTYESVVYNSGKIVKNKSPVGFAPIYYDNTPSPIRVGGSGNLLGPGGIVAGASGIFGEAGTLVNARSPLDYLGVALQTRQLVKSAGRLTSANVANEAYSIAGGAIAGVVGSVLSQPINQTNNGSINNINFYLTKNNSVNTDTQTNPVKLIQGRT
jgi:hypothetical protein